MRYQSVGFTRKRNRWKRKQKHSARLATVPLAMTCAGQGGKGSASSIYPINRDVLTAAMPQTGCRANYIKVTPLGVM